MEELVQFKKYYPFEFENYLFEKVTKNFQKNQSLTKEEFFSIIIWKRNASKTKIRNTIKDSGKTVFEITHSLFEAKNNKQRLQSLTSIKNIGVSIASAILAVCYPDDFTVVDYHVVASLKRRGIEIQGKPDSNKNDYLDYVEKCKKFKGKLTLRNFDRALWGDDFYNGKGGLKDLVKDLK